MPGAQQLLNNWWLLILSRKDSLVFRRHSVLQGHTEGAREGRVSMRAATDTSDLTTLPHQRHLIQPFLPLTPGIVSQAPLPALCTDRPPGLLWTRPGGGGKCEYQRERGSDECERDQGRFYRPERFLQPIDFGSPFAERI